MFSEIISFVPVRVVIGFLGIMCVLTLLTIGCAKAPENNFTPKQSVEESRFVILRKGGLRAPTVYCSDYGVVYYGTRYSYTPFYFYDKNQLPTMMTCDEYVRRFETFGEKLK